MRLRIDKDRTGYEAKDQKILIGLDTIVIPYKQTTQILSRSMNLKTHTPITFDVVEDWVYHHCHAEDVLWYCSSDVLFLALEGDRLIDTTYFLNSVYATFGFVLHMLINGQIAKSFCV